MLDNLLVFSATLCASAVHKFTLRAAFGTHSKKVQRADVGTFIEVKYNMLTSMPQLEYSVLYAVVPSARTN